jgi:hypothetical protein
MADIDSEREQEEITRFFPLVLKVQRGESSHAWKLSRRQKKSGTYLIVAIVLGFFAYARWTAGDSQTAAIIGVIAVVVALLGLSD